ncbi:Transcription factor DIVARICATA [Quillaja saponaria]|uniref:Transcription factor DIVARICATA n=1 Tax=Quillaja saponaria TaxID=32244 RepID=A0AAD7LV80_QUISA|nr:Transcription factor DIVARICATA [Quillaja saponaria]
MEALYPSFMSNSNWFVQDSYSKEWTREENKKFESALAIYDKDTPDRWLKVAAMIPGKTVWDVIKQYKELEDDVSDIEAGRVPIPGYLTSSFTLELVEDRNYDDAYRKRSSEVKGSDQERKKGVPWTEDEHKRFLMGLIKYGKGDWRNISRNFVVTKTPTQVASHAQKYYIRQQLPGGKDKRRPSIHDITTVNLTGTTTVSDDTKPNIFDQSAMVSPQQKSNGTPKIVFNWSYHNDGSVMLKPGQANLFMSSSCDIISNGLKLQGKGLHDNDLHGAYIKPHNSVFQVHSSRYQIPG